MHPLLQELSVVWLWKTSPSGPQTHSVGITWSHLEILLGETQGNPRLLPKPDRIHIWSPETRTFAPQLLKTAQYKVANSPHSTLR